MMGGTVGIGLGVVFQGGGLLSSRILLFDL